MRDDCRTLAVSRAVDGGGEMWYSYPVDVFLCYRRDDAAGHVGRLREDLKIRLGAAHVFQDVSSLAPGDRFDETIRHQIAAADVVFVVMGRNWQDAIDAAGRRRLDDPNDPVRIEIETALAMHKRTVPVLVGGASLPAATVLPDSVLPLLEGNSAEVRDASWPSDLERLLGSLGVRRHRPALRSPRALTALVVAVVATGVAVAVLVDQGRQPSGSAATTAGSARSGGSTVAASTSAASADPPALSSAAPPASAPAVPDPAVGATSATLVANGGACEEPRREDLKPRPTTPIAFFRGDKAKVEVHRWWSRVDPSGTGSTVVMVDVTVTELASGLSLNPSDFAFIVGGFEFKDPPSCFGVFDGFGNPNAIIPENGGKVRVLLTASVGSGTPVLLYFGGLGDARPAIVTLDR